MIRYCSPFAFLASIPILFYLFGATAPLAGVVALVVALIGAECAAPRGESAAKPRGAQSLHALPLGYVLLHLAVIGWAAIVTACPDMTALGMAALTIAVGVTGGVFGMLAAHELIHGKDRLGYFLGSVMLAAMAYPHFRIAHIHGHHRFAATEGDPATARLGEGFYAFLLRTVTGQFAQAYAFEERRRTSPLCHGRINRVRRDLLFVLAVLSVLAFSWSTRAVIFVIAQGAIAILLLELFNYVAHYGLLREKDSEGHYRPFADRHSWNSSNVLANAVIFNMGRHSAHHRRAGDCYAELEYVASAPELPAGYAASLLLALVPPLWFRVMDGEVERQRARGHDGATFAVQTETA